MVLQQFSPQPAGMIGIGDFGPTASRLTASMVPDLTVRPAARH